MPLHPAEQDGQAHLPQQRFHHVAPADVADLMRDHARHLVGRLRRLDQPVEHHDPPAGQRHRIDHRQLDDMHLQRAIVGVDALHQRRQRGASGGIGTALATEIAHHHVAQPLFGRRGDQPREQGRGAQNDDHDDGRQHRKDADRAPQP